MLNNTKTQSRPKLLFLVPAISQTHKSLENSQDFFLSRPRPRSRHLPQDQDREQDFYLKTKTDNKTLFLSSRRLETKTLVSRTTSLDIIALAEEVHVDNYET